MNNIIDILPYEEQIPLRLRAIYEKYGYKKYGMSNFEPYDLYRENRNFIKSGGILTFTGGGGRLMALRPDVTTSIVKHVGANTETEKLYYTENVFRMRHKTGEFEEIRQMGLEYIGGGTAYPEAEVVFLAMESLKTLGTDFRLNISHMGLLEGMLEYTGLGAEASGHVKTALKHKNINDIILIARQAGIEGEKLDRLRTFALVSGEFSSCLDSINALAANDTMREAVSQLWGLYKTLCILTDTGKMQFDISVINDIDYYNGTVFRGYIREAAGAVLSGGRYDNMMRRFGKPQPALGFALYLGELDRALHSGRKYDVDILLLHGDYPQDDIALEVKRLISQGYSVYSCERDDGSLRYKRLMKMGEGGAPYEYD